MADESIKVIRDTIADFANARGIGRVHFAGGSTPPPQLAYLVNFPRLTVVLSGRDRFEFESDGQPARLTLHRGEALFVPANCWNKPAWASAARVLTLLFGKRQTGISLVRNTGGANPELSAIKTHVHRPLAGPVPGILDALSNLYGTPHAQATARHLVQALLHSSVALLESSQTAHGGKAGRTFENICLYLQENFQFPLTRDSVADHFRLSPNHVSRLFRREGLMNFNDYLTWVRIDRAKFLLRAHDQKIAQISASCGFSDAAYFCRVFKRKTRLTPNAYRESHAMA